MTESVSPVLIVLPICVESNEDVFLSILKNVVARTKFEDNYLSGFMKGMMSDELDIGSDDMSVNWKTLHSKAQRRWQSKLIGFWCSNNYPLIGKKLFGDGWTAPQRSYVTSNGRAITADDVDDIVFKKMRLRLIELSVNASTTDRLKWFVKAPASIDIFDPIQLSKKMRAFTIRSGHLEACWKALKFGQFSTTEALSMTSRESTTETMTSGTVHDDLAVDNNDSHPAKRTRVDCVASGELASYEIMTEIRDNVRNLHNLFDPSHVDLLQKLKQKETDCAEANASMIEMAKTNATLETELAETRRALTDEKKNSEAKKKYLEEMLQNIASLESDVQRLTISGESKEIEVKALVAEKKVLEECQKMKMERIAMLESDRLEWIAEKEKAVAMLVSEKKVLQESEKMKTERIAKLESDVNAWVAWAARNEKDMVVEKKKFEEAERERVDWIAKLENHLTEWAGYASSKEVEIKGLVGEKKNLEDLLKASEGRMEASSVNYKKLEKAFILFREEIAAILPDLQGKILELESDLASNEVQETIEHQEGEGDDIQESLDAAGCEVFQSDDPIVNACRPILLTLSFGWIKFNSTKTCTPCPGFVYPPDPDGIVRAQKITSNGYVTNTKNEFFGFQKDIPDKEKEKSQVAKLRLFNKKFGFTFE